jgi:hypothetical protein
MAKVCYLHVHLFYRFYFLIIIILYKSSFWMYGPNWPTGGEFDIIEGVHNSNVNSITGHTDQGCDLAPATLRQTGEAISRNCGNNPIGCQSRVTQPNSFGASFNANGGGVYATLW